MRFRVYAGCALLVITVAMVGCTAKPATKQEVCRSFDGLGAQLLQGNGIIGNPLFRHADELSDVADRYHGPDDLSADAKALHGIAKSDDTSGEELMNATRHIADMCGHPLGMNGLFGGP
jgi:hypothetical protein